MVFRTFFILTIFSWYQINCYVPVPLIYRKAELVLHNYLSNTNYNPIVYSLLNVLVHDKRAKAFVTDEAIESALEDIKNFDEVNVSNIRQIIFGKTKQSKSEKLSDDSQEEVYSALDDFFSYADTGDYNAFKPFSRKKKHHT